MKKRLFVPTHSLWTTNTAHTSERVQCLNIFYPIRNIFLSIMSGFALVTHLIGERPEPSADN